MFSRIRGTTVALAITIILGLGFAPAQLSAQFWQQDTAFAPVLAGQGLESPVVTLARQPDGKIIFAGMLERINGVVPSNPFAPVRLNLDGTTDTTFAATNTAEAIYLQPDGKVVLSGSPSVRLNADGSRDAGFNGSGGLGRIADMDATGRSYSVASNGKIHRYDVTGEEDLGFLSTASALFGFRIAAFADGTAGVAQIGSGSYTIIRLKADGATDATFVPKRQNLPQTLLGLVALPDGRLLVYGHDIARFGISMRFVRLARDGTADYTYAAPGGGSSGPTPADAFTLAGVLYDLLRDASVPTGTSVRAVFATGMVNAVIDVAAGGTATVATTAWAQGSTFARYTRVATGDLTIDPRPSIVLQLTTGTLTPFQGTPLFLSIAGGGLFPLSYQWMKDGVALPGATAATLQIRSCQPADNGAYTLVVSNASGLVSSTPVQVNVNTTVFPLAVTNPITNQTVDAGQRATFTMSAAGNPAPEFTWTFNGAPYTANISSGTGGNGVTATGSSTLSIPSVQPSDAGLYRVTVTGGGATAESTVILGVNPTGKIAGLAAEVGTDIQHPNGNVYDQVLLQGNAATVTADPGQVTRISYVDLTDDIVQVEFAGAGALTLVLENASGPAAPVNYNQNVAYMKGHASIVVSGADESTHVSVFSVGRANAVNQTLFRDGTVYDGYADISHIAIASRDGKFGGVHTGNASYFNTRGATGLYAPGVAFAGPVVVGDVDASAAAIPMLRLGFASVVKIAGGAFAQTNGRAVEVSGIAEIQLVDGMTSQGEPLPAQATQAHFMQDGIDVTAKIVVPAGSQ